MAKKWTVKYIGQDIKGKHTARCKVCGADRKAKTRNLALQFVQGHIIAMHGGGPYDEFEVQDS